MADRFTDRLAYAPPAPHRHARAPRAALFLATLVLAQAPVAPAGMPLSHAPTWESRPYNDFSTGGAWADIDGDGWLDMVVANGNDMSRQYVVIYHNNGDGTLPAMPTWISTDRGYHGHLDIGDVNGDGLPDVAVAVYLGDGGFGDPGGVKLYLNNGAGAFSATADWSPDAPFYCFSVAFADADGDGDLDLACTGGEGYEGYPERQRIFFNHDGVLETVPSWQSDEIEYALDVCWGDIEGDGDADVVFCGNSTPMRVYLNAQTAGGGIATGASWQNTDLPEFGNTTALGDWNGDGLPEVAVADNDQMGGAGRFKVYANQGGLLAPTPAWLSADGGYGSHVSWIDLDLDGDVDLATGRWWAPARIYENLGGALTLDPVWQSSTSSVIENMFWGDVDRDGLRHDGLAIASGDGQRTFFPLGTAPVHAITEVRVNGAPLPPGSYAQHHAAGWISISPPPPPGQQNVAIRYDYSIDLDLGVTNWDPQLGNYLFTNLTCTVDVPPAADAIASFTVAPNPMAGSTQIRYHGEALSSARVALLDVSGRRVRTLHEGALAAGLITWQWDRRDDHGREVPRGAYFVRLAGSGAVATRRLIVL